MGRASRRRNLSRLRQAKLGQRHAVDILHRDGGHVAIALKVMDADDIWVRQPKGISRLFLEFIDGDLVARNDLRQELQRHGIAEFIVAGPPDNPHAALPQHGLEEVASEHLLPCGQSAHGRPVVGFIHRHTLGGVVVCHGPKAKRKPMNGSIGNPSWPNRTMRSCPRMHTNPHECPDTEYHGREHWRLDQEFVAIRVHRGPKLPPRRSGKALTA